MAEINFNRQRRFLVNLTNEYIPLTDLRGLTLTPHQNYECTEDYTLDELSMSKTLLYNVRNDRIAVWNEEKRLTGDELEACLNVLSRYEVIFPDSTVGNHAFKHEDGGIDEVNVTGLSGSLADAQDASSIWGYPIDSGISPSVNEVLVWNGVQYISAPIPDSTSVSLHNWTHETGGIDEIDVGGLFGSLADAQDASSVWGYPIDPTISPSLNEVLVWDGNKYVSAPVPDSTSVPLHHETHETGGIDEINVTGLFGSLADSQDASSIHGYPIDPTISPTENDILIWDGSKFILKQQTDATSSYDGDVFVYDPVRDKYLSTSSFVYTFGLDKNAKNRYMYMTGDVANTGVGYLLPYEMCLISLTARHNNASGGTFYFRKNGAGANLETLTTASGSGYKTDCDIDLDIADYIQMYVGATKCAWPVATAILKRRKPSV